MRPFALLLSCLICFSLWASEVKLATITSDIDTNTTVFYAISGDDGDIVGMRYIKTIQSGQVYEDESFTVDEVGHGVTVERRGGHEIVKLYIEKFDGTTGGTVRLNFLYNGVTGVMKDLKLKVLRLDDEFILNDFAGNRVTRLVLKGHWIRILGLVGIREISSLP